ncbi:hypothetical protein ZHAS_00013233 [Anopheles sinensis]|uniref:Uncharacterized protein n=1 Tax=Anopheles sinensis TaxID=74873 RepID=A0A084W4Z6_ANOSI|nr:hypothetical protein ZHAS_00013233 [Anopheles sinensis]
MNVLVQRHHRSHGNEPKPARNTPEPEAWSATEFQSVIHFPSNPSALGLFFRFTLPKCT